MIREGVESFRIAREAGCAHLFIPPVGCRVAADRLDKPGSVALLEAPPGSGSRAAAIMLLPHGTRTTRTGADPVGGRLSEAPLHRTPQRGALPCPETWARPSLAGTLPGQRRGGGAEDEGAQDAVMGGRGGRDPTYRPGAVLARREPDAQLRLHRRLDAALHICLDLNKTRRVLGDAAIRRVRAVLFPQEPGGAVKKGERGPVKTSRAPSREYGPRSNTGTSPASQHDPSTVGANRGIRVTKGQASQHHPSTGKTRGSTPESRTPFELHVARSDVAISRRYTLKRNSTTSPSCIT